MYRLLLHTLSSALLLLLLLLQAAPGCEGTTTYSIVDGFLHESPSYPISVSFDLLGLEGFEGVSSTATILGGSISADVTVEGLGMNDPVPDLLVTSLYMLFDGSVLTGNGRIMVSYLIPDMYLHIKSITAIKNSNTPTVQITSSFLHQNTTVYFVDATINYGSGQGALSYGLYMNNPATGNYGLMDHGLVHIHGMRVSSGYGLLSSSTANGAAPAEALRIAAESAIVLASSRCDACKNSIIKLQKMSLFTHAGFIVLNCFNYGSEAPLSTAVIAASTVSVDETSTFAIVDLNTANGFTMNAPKNPLFSGLSISGAGVITMLRLVMHTSGLSQSTPASNANFWASASMEVNVHMTGAQLRAQKLNVKDSNVLAWEGTLASNCAPVGGALPDRATYAKVGASCTPTCKSGFLAPACTAPATDTCAIPGCELCNRRGTECLVCEALHTRSDDGKLCYQCMANCQSCSADNYCTSCQPPFNPSPNKDACYNCPIQDCTECPTTGQCEACASGLSPSPDGTACVSCSVANCQRCASDLVCETCKDDHIKAPDGSSCHPCVDGVCDALCPPGCKHCTISGECLECEVNFTPIASSPTGDSDGVTCVSCAIANCKSCEVPDVCAACEPSHSSSHDHRTCIPCLVGECAQCDAPNKCVECTASGASRPINGSCVPCNVPHCKYCSAADTCGECADRYASIDGGRSCISCNVEHCESCNPADACRKCKPKYHLNRHDGTCVACGVEGCARCDIPGVCALCKGSMTVAKAGAACVPCSITNCMLCNKAQTCSLCECGMVPTEDGTRCVPCKVNKCDYCDAPGDGTTCAQCEPDHEPTASSSSKDKKKYNVCKAKKPTASWIVIVSVVVISINILLAWASIFYCIYRYRTRRC